MKRFSSLPSAPALILAAFALAVCVVTMGAAAIKTWPRSVAEERNIFGDGCFSVPRSSLPPEDSLTVEEICDLPLSKGVEARP